MTRGGSEYSLYSVLEEVGEGAMFNPDFDGESGARSASERRVRLV